MFVCVCVAEPSFVGLVKRQRRRLYWLSCGHNHWWRGLRKWGAGAGSCNFRADSCKLPTGDIMVAQNFNFAPKLLQNGWFSGQNIGRRLFLTRTKLLDQLELGRAIASRTPPCRDAARGHRKPVVVDAVCQRDRSESFTSCRTPSPSPPPNTSVTWTRHDVWLPPDRLTDVSS